MLQTNSSDSPQERYYHNIFVRLLDKYNDILEDWTITHEYIQLIPYFHLYKRLKTDQRFKDNYERLEDLLRRLNVLCCLLNITKKITLGGRKVYTKYTPHTFINK